MPRRRMFERSVETQKLLDLFLALPLDTPMSFADASALVRFRVHSSLGAYRSARIIGERRHSLVIEAIRGSGFQRLTGMEISEAGERGMRSIRVKARREGNKQGIAIADNLDDAHAKRSSELLNRFNLIADIASKPRSNHRPAPPPAPSPPPPEDNRDRLREL